MKKIPKSKQRRTCRLILLIHDEDGQETAYVVRPIPSELHLRAYQFRKDEETTYAVAQEYSGLITCDCGKFIYRGGLCKHGSAGRAMGLFLSSQELHAIRRSTAPIPQARGG